MEGREMYTEKRKKANIKVENQKERGRQRKTHRKTRNGVKKEKEKQIEW